MIEAKLSALTVGEETFYKLEVFKDGDLIHSEEFSDIYKAKSAQREWWRN